MATADFNCAPGDAYVTKALPSASSFQVSVIAYMPAATIAALFSLVTTTAEWLNCRLVGGVSYDGIHGQDDGAGGGNFGTDHSGFLMGAFAADTNFTIVCEITYLSGNNWQFDWSVGSLLWSYSVNLGAPGPAALEIRVGGVFSLEEPGELYKIKGVDVIADGTPVFSDDFSSLDFSAWDSVTGDCTVEGADVDTTPPTLIRQFAFASTVRLVYNEQLSDTPGPDVSEFAVTVNGVAATVTAVAVSGANVNLTLAAPVAAGDVVLVSYAA